MARITGRRESPEPEASLGNHIAIETTVRTAMSATTSTNANATVCIADGHCSPCEGGVAPLAPQVVAKLLAQLDHWVLEGSVIARTFQFKNHYETMAFANAVAWISHREDHHPEMVVGYAECTVRYWTHAIGGLSDNDFSCAAKVDRLIAA